MWRRKPVFLLILDGFGLRSETANNAVACAQTPNLDRLFSTYSCTSIYASSEAVGLPEGYIGSSEVGHMNIGAGRIVLQGLQRINNDIRTGEFAINKVFCDAMRTAREKRLHIMGLLSDGGVHSHIDHLFALLELAKKKCVEEVYIHAFLDGRDVEPSCAQKYIDMTEKKCQELGLGNIASLHGRFYAMDRDNRWDRVQESYNCLTKGSQQRAQNASDALKEAYDHGETDEFVKPITIDEKGLIKEGDAIIHFNFREDRAREITAAFTLDKFKEFKREKMENHYVCMTEYDSSFKLPVAYPWVSPENTLGEYISTIGGTQLRVAETEKYAHVTYFFSGGREKAFKNEERILIHSDRSVPTYDLHPSMRTKEIAQKAIEDIQKNKPDLVVCNIAAPDMVGHTGVFEATVKAVEVVDKQVGKIASACLAQGYLLCITADHGNCEEMEGVHKTSHTLNPVPFCVVENDEQGNPIHHHLIPEKQGVLGDIAPTILKMIDVPVPPEMTRPGLIQ